MAQSTIQEPTKETWQTALIQSSQGAVYQNRIEQATLISHKFSIPSGSAKIVVVYCVFKTLVAIHDGDALATGFPIPYGNSAVIAPGEIGNKFAQFYINQAGSVCAAQEISAGTWCQCSCTYMTN